MQLKPLILTAGALAALSPLAGQTQKQTGQSDKRPNIIFIVTDQQSAVMMSCAGNTWLNTPGMDYIGNNGVRFTRAYTTNPVSSPARLGFMTGRFPGSFTDAGGNKADNNNTSMGIRNLSPEVLNTTIGAWLKRAGYDLVYGGKTHLPEQLMPKPQGFAVISSDERDELAKSGADFIRERHDKPYYMVLSFINPHDICYMAISDFGRGSREAKEEKNPPIHIKMLEQAKKMPAGVTKEEFYAKWCPPLPPNYEIQEGEPKAIDNLISQAAFSFRKQAREHYTDEQWRLHRWTYCRLTEVVDAEVQQVVDALKASGEEENTIVIFTADHGDMDASHRLEHKSLLYEQAANIPFVVMWKGHIVPRVDDKHLVSNGLDLLPTVCDYAGVKGGSDPRGLSLRPLLEGDNNTPWRKTLGVESEVGSMVVSADGCKYARYDLGGIEEQIYDLNKDPYETKHFTSDPNYKSKLAELRRDFDSVWFPNF